MQDPKCGATTDSGHSQPLMIIMHSKGFTRGEISVLFIIYYYVSYMYVFSSYSIVSADYQVGAESAVIQESKWTG